MSSKTEVLRSEILGTPLAHHSLNQEIMKSVSDGDNRLFGTDRFQKRMARRAKRRHKNELFKKYPALKAFPEHKEEKDLDGNSSVVIVDFDITKPLIIQPQSHIMAINTHIRTMSLSLNLRSNGGIKDINLCVK